MATDGIDPANVQPWDDYLRENYAAVREQRGWSWDELSAYLHSIDAAELAEWAASQDVSKRSETPIGDAVEQAVVAPLETA